MKIWKTLILFVFLGSWLMLSAANSVILDIRVEGTKNVDEELIRSAITFDIGEAVNPEDIAQSIKNLYQLSIFKDVAILQEDLPQGVAVVIDLEEFPIVKKLTVRGNKKIGDSEMEDLISLREGSYWSPFIEKETTRRIKKEYSSKGYLDAKASYTIKEDGKNKVRVIMKIDEGKKVKVRQIKILGNEQIATKTILRKMKKTKKKSWFRSGKFDESEFDDDLIKVINFYNKKGFLDAYIVSQDARQVDEKSIHITIELNEGEQFRFGDVHIQGQDRFTEETLKNVFKFKENDIFNKEKFDMQFAEIPSLYFEEGYIYAQVTPEIVKKGGKADININIVENIRAKVRKIKITGNRKTKEKIVRRQMVIHPGDYFQKSKVMQSQRNVYNLGFFEPDIGLDYRPINDQGDVDLVISVNDRTSGTANGGIGYNSEDKVVGQLSVSHNNLLGNSWRSSLEWEFSGSKQNVNLEFTNPYVFDTSILAGFNIYYTKKEYDTSNYIVDTRGGGLQLGKSVNFLNFARVIGGYSLYTKRYKVLDDDEAVSDVLQDYVEKNWQYSSSTSLTISRDSRDNVFFPSSGTQFTLFTELAGGPFGGDFDYFKQIFQTSWYTKLYYDFVLRTKWRFGYVTEYGSSDEVPLDERFYLGGTGNDGIRGYPDRSIAPIDGGHREILFSGEIAYPIAQDSVIGLLFFDAGDSFNTLEEYNFLQMYKGAGLGVRIRSPFGIIGFDYARNFDNNTWEPHLQMGTTF